MTSEPEIILNLAKQVGSVKDCDKFCFEALTHVSTLLDADRCSLFLARDTPTGDGKELASRLWNVTQKSSFEAAMCDAKNEFVVAFDVGIAGHVAQTREKLNVSNVYEHPNFTKMFDEKTGFVSRDIMCLPLILPDDDKLVGVVEVVNKKNEEPFTEEDEEVAQHFIVLCALAIQHTRRSAQITRLEQAGKLQDDLAASVASNWQGRSLDAVLKEVLTKISEAIKCERYTLAIALVDNCNIEGCLPLAKSYDMLVKKGSNLFGEDDGETQIDVIKLKKNDWIFGHKVIEKVLEEKKMVNMSKISPFSEFKLEDAKKEFSLKTVLCTSYYDSGGKLLGVLHLANKKGGFTEGDEETLETIRPYIVNGLLYANGFNSIRLNKAKEEVSEEIVRFNIRADENDVDKLKVKEIPPGEDYNLYEFTFSDLPMIDDETVLAAMRMFTDIDAFNMFKIPQTTMLRWILSVKRCYRPVYYHNWRHGFNVAHTMFLLQDRMIKDSECTNINNIYTDVEKFALIVGSFCHDIDHRGTNNAFLIRAGAPLAVLYNTSTLENHHYNTCLQISRMEGSDIFASFTDEEFTYACEIMKHAILATDLALYFQRRNTFRKLLDENKPEARDFTTTDNKMLLMSMLMTACDLSSITKPWEVQQLMAVNVTNEFYDQGDQERLLFGTEPIAMMDRKKQKDLPKMQIGFIDGVCSMVYEMMADFCNGYAPLRDGMRANRQHWTERAKAEGLDVDTGPAKKETKDDDGYANMWEKYWNMDPENFIWGIDPNEAPPEVVIERVVFSPKKKMPKALTSEISNGEKTPAKGRKKKKLAAQFEKDSGLSRKSPVPSAASDSGSSSKNSKMCRVM
ncbi:cGMP-specific 3',5'-cyclic phosphodiesterase-like [Styela clava]|uniref:cGMP-specific 3',5'-cyclic phosphodiesterase-like n=1 Tax=Styela clava TaxID=7725 RepID=UPI001939385C|nr:cGMP-specific 3',5'-cyclic phosphodiesterase-like [Styela clava]